MGTKQANQDLLTSQIFFRKKKKNCQILIIKMISILKKKIFCLEYSRVGCKNSLEQLKLEIVRTFSGYSPLWKAGCPTLETFLAVRMCLLVFVKQKFGLQNVMQYRFSLSVLNDT
jgi:hypothetical protein